MTRPMSEEELRHLVQDCEIVGSSPERHSRIEIAAYLLKAKDALLSTSASERGLREALSEVMEWIAGWDPSFTEDDDWPATLTKVRAALSPKGEG